MQTAYQRKVSPIERLFTVLAETDPPFCNSMVVEGTGAIDIGVWQKAVAEACEANPGSRLVYKGRSVWAKWVDSGVATPIRFVDGSKWSGYDPTGAPFLYDPFPIKTSHTSEVVVVKGNPQRIIFRTSHATMDATGTLMWAMDIFRALRKEPLVGSPATFNDKELVAGLNFRGKEPSKLKECLIPTSAPDGDTPGFTWKRVRLEGKYSKLLAQFALAVSKEARKQGPGNVRIAVPLDLRKRVPDTCSTANLTRRVILDIPPDATVESIDQQLRDRLSNLNRDPQMGIIVAYIPSKWLKKIILFFKNKNRKRGYYRDSGTISNGGKLPMEPLQGGGFVTKSFFWIPSQLETKPFFLSCIGYGSVIEVLIGMPRVLASNGRLDNFVANIISELNPISPG